MRFDELDLEDDVLDGLDAMNFLETTPVQELTIPLILEGKDIIACAQTGTGKTAAYVLPLINELSKGNHLANAVNAVVMAPTRELALFMGEPMALPGNNRGKAWKRAPTLSLLLPDACFRISNWARWTCRTCPILFWTRPTGCSTWVFMKTLCRCINACLLRARL